MGRTITFCLIALALSIWAAWTFVRALEIASANRKADGGSRRRLELGYTGRAVVAVVFLVPMLLLAWMSNIKVLGMIVALILAVGLVAANVFLRRNGIKASFALALVWCGNLVSALLHSKLMTGNVWDVIYIIVQVVCLILILAASAIAYINAIRLAFKKENEDADELEEEVRRVAADDDDEEGTVNDESDGDEVEEEDEEEESSGIDVWGVLIRVLAIALIIVTAFVLEAKFDFLPPYNF